MAQRLHSIEAAMGQSEVRQSSLGTVWWGCEAHSQATQVLTGRPGQLGQVEAGQAGEHGHRFPLPPEAMCIPAGTWADTQSRCIMESLLPWWALNCITSALKAGLAWRPGVDTGP